MGYPRGREGHGKPKVYIAGPMVFYPDAEDVFSEMKATLGRHGLDGCAPLDNQIGLERIAPGRELAAAIYRADEELMRTVDAAIFNIDPFRRGTEMDAGTAFEVGFCRALGLPMVAWTTDCRTYPEKVSGFMKETFGLDLQDGPRHVSGGTSGALRDADGILVHSEGMYQNLMIDMAIEAAGGKVVAASDWKVAFSTASSLLGEIIAMTASRPHLT